MTKRHNRTLFYLANTGRMCGEVDRPATPAEEQRAFRFSRIVESGTPAPSDALLEALAGRMTQAAADVDSHIPAGFTYLGQFVDHDLTRDRTQVAFGTAVPPDQLVQARSPALDLDSVYGEGPQATSSAAFYQADGVRLKLGQTKVSGGPPIESLDLDGFDLPRKGASGPPEEARQALIADPRNDENLAVGQTHLAFLRFHNAVCDRLAGSTPSALLFERARKAVVKHYQWMLRFDFLPRIVDQAIIDDVFSVGRRFFEVGAQGFPTMPVEFSVAAYRLGHSMIREKYDWNAVFGPGGSIGDFGTLDNLFRFSGTSGNLSPFGAGGPAAGPSDLNNPLDGTFERLPTNWITDWTRMFDFAADGVPELAPEPGHAVNKARPLDIRLTDPLRTLPLGSFGARGGGLAVPPAQLNLAFRNLVRGRMVRLATGQEMVNAMQDAGIAVQPLTSAEIIGSEFTGLSQALKDELVTATPLWFYVLREAGLRGGKMGSIGGRIVAEVFHRAIEGSNISILRDPFFSPTLGRVAGMFRMTDLLGLAYNAAAGELRPLSVNAPRPAAAQMQPSG